MQKKSKIILSVLLGIIIILSSIGVSYAYWKVTMVGEDKNNITSGCFNLEMINQKDEISLSSTYPITDEEGLKLKPFSFTLKNTCTIFAHYYVNMEMLEGTTLNSKFVAVRVNNEKINTLDTYKTTSTVIDGSTESRIIAEGYLGADEEVDYTVSFWMDEDVTLADDVMNKNFKSKIIINSEPGKYDPVSAGYDTLKDAILANEYQTTPEISKSKIATKQAVDLTQTAPIIKWVEKTGISWTVPVSKPTINSVNSDDATSDLTENDTKIKLYTSYSFDPKTAKYTLSNMIYADPTTLDYSGSTKYYFANENISYDNFKGKLYTWNSDGDVTVYRLNSASKTTETTTWNGKSYESNNYVLQTTILTEEELETDKSDKGLYQATDDYGTTYYYRGNVKNNNLYYAGMYWQIVRINGDGSVRLIYNGTSKNATGINQAINTTTYQFNGTINSPAYVGYMYGNTSGTTFSEVHSNTNSSNIKTVIDNWYKDNIVDKGYSDYVSSDVGFCGDRSLYKEGDGIANNQTTYFGAYERFEKNTAEFTCPDVSNDLYTTASSSIGNKALTYPVGLITYDELIFAGMRQQSINKLSYIYSSNHFWTMSPSNYGGQNTSAGLWLLDSAGSMYVWAWGNASYGVRPVINLKSDVKITGGTGTVNDPFVVATN